MANRVSQKVTISYDAQMRRLTAKMRQVERLHRSSATSMSRAIGRVSSGWRRWKANIVTANAAIGLAGQAVRGITSLIRPFNQALAASAAQATGIRQLEFSFRRLDTPLGIARSRLEEFATEMQNTTRFGDSTTRTMATQFQAFAGSAVSSIDEVISGVELIMDISEQSGKSITRITRAVAQAAGGSTEALSSLLPGEMEDLRGTLEAIAANSAMTDLEQNAAVAQVTFAALNEQFDGARFMIDATEQKMAQLANEWSDAWESMGDSIRQSLLESGILDDMIEKVQEVTTWFAENRNEVSDFFTTFIDLAGSALDVTVFLVNALGTAHNILTLGIPAALNGLSNETNEIFGRLLEREAEARRSLDASGERTGPAPPIPHRVRVLLREAAEAAAAGIELSAELRDQLTAQSFAFAQSFEPTAEVIRPRSSGAAADPATPPRRPTSSASADDPLAAQRRMAEEFLAQLASVKSFVIELSDKQAEIAATAIEREQLVAQAVVESLQLQKTAMGELADKRLELAEAAAQQAEAEKLAGFAAVSGAIGAAKAIVGAFATRAEAARIMYGFVAIEETVEMFKSIAFGDVLGAINHGAAAAVAARRAGTSVDFSSAGGGGGPIAPDASAARAESRLRPKETTIQIQGPNFWRDDARRVVGELVAEGVELGET